MDAKTRRRQRNGRHRDPQLSTQARRRILAQVRAEEPCCHLCGRPIDLALCRQTHPYGSTVDELLPRSLGGSATDRSNVRHAHRRCQTIRGVKPITPSLIARIQSMTGGTRTTSSAW